MIIELRDKRIYYSQSNIDCFLTEIFWTDSLVYHIMFHKWNFRLKFYSKTKGKIIEIYFLMGATVELHVPFSDMSIFYIYVIITKHTSGLQILLP